MLFSVVMVPFSRWINGVAEKEVTSRKFRFKDEHKSQLDSGLLNRGYKEITLSGSQGTKLVGVLRLTDSSKPFFVYFHGRGSNIFDNSPKRSETVMLSALADAGMNVLCVDYPGYGKSTGKASYQGVLDTADIVMDFMHTLQFPDGKKLDTKEDVIMMGTSLGTLSLARCISEMPVKGVVFSVPVTQIDDIVSNVGRGVFKPLGNFIQFRLSVEDGCRKSLAENALVIYNSYDNFSPPLIHAAPIMQALKESETDLKRYDVEKVGLPHRNHSLKPEQVYTILQHWVNDIYHPQKSEGKQPKGMYQESMESKIVRNSEATMHTCQQSPANYHREVGG